MVVVISQPMLFPWVGMLEQVVASDVFIHYPDVQYSKGSLVNRVQLKTARGPRWLAVPPRDLHLGQRIDQVAIDESRDWRAAHKELIAQALAGAPFLDDALALADQAYRERTPEMGSLATASMMALCGYYGLGNGRRFLDSRDLGVGGSGSQRVLDLVRAVGGDTYVTGHGARNYLDHAAFEAAGVEVRYMDYRKLPYPQRHGEFTPFVSGLDLVANTGPTGIQYLQPVTLYWKDFLSHERD